MLDLLLPCVVEHAGNEEVDGDTDQASEDDHREDPRVHRVLAFVDVAVEVVKKSLVTQALIAQLFLHLLWVDRNDRDNDRSGNDTHNRANQEDNV